MLPPPSPNTVAVCNNITFLILYYIRSRLVNLLQVTIVPIQLFDIINHIVIFKFNYFSFQTLPLSLPIMFTG